MPAVSLHLRDAGRDAVCVVAYLALTQVVVESAGTSIATWTALAITAIAAWATLRSPHRRDLRALSGPQV